MLKELPHPGYELAISHMESIAFDTRKKTLKLLL
jgi:hypothetical protein